jgi:hypothetical protein
MGHYTVAASSKAVSDLVGVLRDAFTFESAAKVNVGAYEVGYEIALHLAGGTVELHDDNTIEIRDLEIKWDKLEASIGLDVPETCIGGQCIVATPVGCAVRLPRACAFEASPDIGISIDLSGIATSRLSVTAKPVTRRWVDPSRPPKMTDLEAYDKKIADKWQIWLPTTNVEIEPLDVAETATGLIEKALDDAVKNKLSALGLPGVIQDLILAALGPLMTILRSALKPAGDIHTWLAHEINERLEFPGKLAAALVNYFKIHRPLHQWPDPYPILPGGPKDPKTKLYTLIPVMIPLVDVGVRATSSELVIEASVGP